MMYKYMNGSKFCYKDNSQCLHREDGPAIEYASGYKAWYQNGVLHREDGPAIEHSNGDKAWYLNNKLIAYEVEFLRLVKLKAFW